MPKAIILDVDYIFKKNEKTGFAVLILKTKKGIIRRYYKFRPYFYVDTADKEIVKKMLDSQGLNVIIEETLLKIDNKEGAKKVLKIMVEKPSDIQKAKNIIEAAVEKATFYEYDIPIRKRFLIDLGLEPFSIIYYKTDEKNKKIIKEITAKKEADMTKIKLKTMSFDIEVYNPQGIPDPSRDEIIFISIKNKNKTFGISNLNDEKIRKVTNEKEMLITFDEILKEQKPDIIFGYNSSYFDLPYIESRAKRLKLKLEFLKKAKKVSKGLIKGFKLRKAIHVDVYHVARLLNIMGIIEAERLTLSELYKSLFNKEKYMINRLDIWKYWDENKKELINYALEDAIATYEIGNELLPLEIEISRTAKTPLFETSLSTAGQLVESALMYYAKKDNYLIPKKPNQKEIEKRLMMPIKGGFVKLPNPGIYDNIAVLDFRGLYPSIIVSYNVDPFTITDSDKNCYISPVGVKFKKEPKGLIPKVLDEIITKRAEIKKLIKKTDHKYLKARSQALKILANSFYGYLGYARSRWYSRECAESITAWGREHIQKAAKEAEKEGFEVLYIDTDSLFLLLKNKTKNDVLKFIEKFNKTLPEKMELELEDFYKRAVFVSKKSEEKGAKKKYALLSENGTIKIRGFELVRRDWSDIARDTQKIVLETILKEGNKEKAISIVKDVIEKIKKGSLPIEKFVIKTQINKNIEEYEATSPELMAAKRLKEMGRPVSKGSIISFVITKKGNSISEKAYPLELAKDYDADYYIKNQILPAVMKLLKELGVKEDEILNNLQQKSLGSYFK